jgi:alkanesulfonate monooxygenase SsuD/methylene tetrahydromethanopterin reductase-like flavin-dependent oxidoreductase (luciferase family)
VTVGGGGEQMMLRVVAKHADRWNWNGDREAFRHKVDVLKARCEEVGRDFESIEKSYWGMVSIDRSREEAVRKAKEMPTGSSFESFMTHHAVGTPDDVASFFAPYVDMGARYFVLQINESAGIESLKLFMDEVVPKL